MSKKTSIVLIYFVLIFTKMNAQQNSTLNSIHAIDEKEFKNSYEQLNFYRNVESDLKNHSDDSLRIFYQVLSYLNAFASNYEESKKTMYEKGTNSNNDFYKPIFSQHKFQKYKPKNINDFLDSIASTYQIIIFNEAHNLPQNRITTLRALNLLYKKGFRYLALEALSDKDTLINKRGYALSHYSSEGYHFIDEPCFGDMIRVACKIGFKLVPYEFKSKNPLERESNQATNIVNRILKRDTKAKVIIHNGYSHGDKDPDLKQMGYFLKQMTNAKIIFLDQWRLSSSIDSSFESPDYRYAVTVNKMTEPTVFIEPFTKKIWKLDESFGDVPLFLPKTNIINGRPDWLLFGAKKVYFPLIDSMGIISFPVLLQALKTSEGKDAIPVDQFEMTQINDKKCLFLYADTYTIRILDKNGIVIYSKEIIIR